MAAVQGLNFPAILKSGIGVPIGVLGILMMIVLPMPPMALDLLFTFTSRSRSSG